MDEAFTLFLEEFGPGVRYGEVSEEFLIRHRGILPEILLGFLREEGWCSYADGLVWTVNPDDFSWLVNGWLREAPEIPKADYYVFARSAYGEFYCLSPNLGRVLTISCPHRLLISSKAILTSEKGADNAIDLFFSSAEKEDFDFFDGDEVPLFPLAYERLGPLGVGEVYGFVPLLTLGGEASVENLRKLRMDVHLDILEQSAALTTKLF